MLIYSRSCPSMSGVAGPAICYAAKIFSGSAYDHIGIVVEDLDGTRYGDDGGSSSGSSSGSSTCNNSPDAGRSNTRNKLYMLEANFGGVTCYPLNDRIGKTKVSVIYAIYT